jgi:hypothetical protein
MKSVIFWRKKELFSKTRKTAFVGNESKSAIVKIAEK